MKTHIALFIVVIFSVFVSGCAYTDKEICENGYYYNQEIGKCVKETQNHNKEHDNPINLNITDATDWTYNFMESENSKFAFTDNIFKFTQSDYSVNDTTVSRKISYNYLSFEFEKVYELSFTIYGTTGEKFEVEIKTSEDKTYKFSYVLDGTEQDVSMKILNPGISDKNGEISFFFGTFSDKSQIMIYNFGISKQERADAEMNILFVGNSFTYYNDMPNIVEHMGKSIGFEKLNIEHVTFGGTTLEKFATPATEQSKAFVSKMNEKQWDYVILQDHSSRPYTNKTSFLNSVQTLTEYIKGKDAEVLLYSTWAYRDGSNKLASTRLSYDEFYTFLQEGYEEAAQINNIESINVGTVFYNLNKDHPEINLLDQNDDFHPNALGSYTVAYMFFVEIFGEEYHSYTTSDNFDHEILGIVKQYILDEIK